MQLNWLKKTTITHTKKKPCNERRTHTHTHIDILFFSEVHHECNMRFHAKPKWWNLFKCNTGELVAEGKRSNIRFAAERERNKRIAAVMIAAKIGEKKHGIKTSNKTWQPPLWNIYTLREIFLSLSHVLLDAFWSRHSLTIFQYTAREWKAALHPNGTHVNINTLPKCEQRNKKKKSDWSECIYMCIYKQSTYSEYARWLCPNS